jgi:hypothetical protein
MTEIEFDCIEDEIALLQLALRRRSAPARTLREYLAAAHATSLR